MRFDFTFSLIVLVVCLGMVTCTWIKSDETVVISIGSSKAVNFACVANINLANQSLVTKIGRCVTIDMRYSYTQPYQSFVVQKLAGAGDSIFNLPPFWFNMYKNSNCSGNSTGGFTFSYGDDNSGKCSTPTFALSFPGMTGNQGDQGTALGITVESPSNLVPIVAGVLGSLLGLTIILCAVLFVKLRKIGMYKNRESEPLNR